MNQINFGENVRRIRAIKGYTQEYMATRLGFKGQNKYSRIENSPEIPSTEIVNAIAAIFEMSVAELLTPQVLLDTPEKQKARVGIYTTIIYFFAVGVGIICASPTWQMADNLCYLNGVTEWRAAIRLTAAFLPMIIYLWIARRVMMRYKAAYGID